jgi:hypothetical protein
MAENDIITEFVEREEFEGEVFERVIFVSSKTSNTSGTTLRDLENFRILKSALSDDDTQRFIGLANLETAEQLNKVGDLNHDSLLMIAATKENIIALRFYLIKE